MNSKNKKVYTTGVFDILHRGHLNILTQAAALGDLVVAVQTDQGVLESKGRMPILSYEERVAQLESLPFVKEVQGYRIQRQTHNYELIKPDIIVQGDDWLMSGDRTEELAYCKEHGIRVVLLPRTEGISTTEIRRRVERSGRKDEAFLKRSLKLVKIEDLKVYEEYDEAKVKKIMDKIRRDGVFFNPISIVEDNIVIDGNNRLEALRRYGAKYVPCVVYRYADIDLVGNVHFIKDGKITRLSEFAPEEGERKEFPARTPEDIRQAVREGRMIPNGETFHRVPQSVIRLPIPLSELVEEGFDLDTFVDERIKAGEIRFYQSNVYICDEYE